MIRVSGGCERAYHFVEIERDFAATTTIAGQFEHVTGLTPALLGIPVFLVALIIVQIGIQATTADDSFQAWLETLV